MMDALRSGRVAHRGPAADKLAGSRMQITYGPFPTSILASAPVFFLFFLNGHFSCVGVWWSRDSERAACQVLMVQSCGGGGRDTCVYHLDNEL